MHRLPTQDGPALLRRYYWPEQRTTKVIRWVYLHANELHIPRIRGQGQYMVCGTQLLQVGFSYHDSPHAPVLENEDENQSVLFRGRG